MEDNLFVQLLLYIAFGGGAILAAYELMERVPKLAEIPNPWHKRLISYVVSGSLGIVAYLILLWLGVRPEPVTAQEWVVQLGSVALGAAGLTTLIHGQQKLPRSK
jgi:hypothetical protein